MDVKVNKLGSHRGGMSLPLIARAEQGQLRLRSAEIGSKCRAQNHQGEAKNSKERAKGAYGQYRGGLGP